MTKPQKAKLPISCAHCGEEFTPERSTAKYCQDKCRILAFQKKQREQDRAAKKREARNKRRRKLEELRRNWQAVTDREDRHKERVFEAIRDEHEGWADQDKIDRLTQERDAHKPLIDRDKRRVEKIAARWSFDMDIIKNPPEVNRKPKPEKPSRKVVEQPVERPAFEKRTSKPMPKVETKRKRVVKSSKT